MSSKSAKRKIATPKKNRSKSPSNEPLKRGRGRPTSYRPEYAEQVAKLCELAATDQELADFFKVDVRTIFRWKLQHPDFCQALVLGKDMADSRVERAMYHKAAGYDYKEQQVVKLRIAENLDRVEVVEVTKHVPADTVAGKFWLTNRRGKHWKERFEHGIGGLPDAPPIQTQAISAESLSMPVLKELMELLRERQASNRDGQ